MPLGIELELISTYLPDDEMRRHEATRGKLFMMTWLVDKVSFELCFSRGEDWFRRGIYYAGGCWRGYLVFEHANVTV